MPAGIFVRRGRPALLGTTMHAGAPLLLAAALLHGQALLSGSGASAQVVVANGTSIDLNTPPNSPTISATDQSTLEASNGGVITGSNVALTTHMSSATPNITSAAYCGQPTVVPDRVRCTVSVLQGGRIVLTGGTITGTNDPARTTEGVSASGLGATFIGSNLTVTSTNGHGIRAQLGGQMQISDSQIVSSNPGMVANTVPGTSVVTAPVDSPTVIVATNVTVRTTGAAGSAAEANSQTYNGVNLLTEIQSAHLVWTGGSGDTVGAVAYGIGTTGTYTTVQATDIRLATQGAGAIGIRARSGAEATIIGGSVSTAGAGSYGLHTLHGPSLPLDGLPSTILTDGTPVTTTGANATGAYSLGGGRIEVRGGGILTGGDNASGAHASGIGAAALNNVPSRVILNNTSVTTGVLMADDPATAYFDPRPVDAAGNPVSSPAAYVASAATGAHGLQVSGGGAIAATDTTVRTLGADAAGILATGGTAAQPNTVTMTGGALTSSQSDLIRATGGVLDVSLQGVTTGNGGGYVLRSLAGTGGAASAVNATFSGVTLRGDILADPGSTADVSLLNASTLTGRAQDATNVTLDGSSAWTVTAASTVTGTTTNAGLIQFAAAGTPGLTLTTGSYVGQGGVIGLNTVLAGDGAASDRLVINGGTASGDTRLRITNAGGAGAQTIADGIRVVEAANGGTTAAGAFRLDTRVVAGAFEYQLFRGGSTSADDWFLRSYLVPEPTEPTTPTTPPSTPAIPLYRPEVALYAPIPAIARQMGLATLGTLHERVGEEENLRGIPGSRAYANGGWARAFGERTRNRWDGTVDARATGNLIGLQAGFDILRRTTDSGHRDHAGIYVAYTDYNAPRVSGFALGVQNLQVGRLLMSGPAVGAYWTHFGPSGWYVDAVFQANWFNVSARSDFGTGLSTSGVGYTASLETGYPIRFGEGQRWQIEPQAQLIWQGVSVDRANDQFSTIDWNEGNAVTGRLGARLQYTGRDERTLWQPYAKVNLWHAFSGTDRVSFGSGAPIENRFGDTALEIGGGITARVSQTTSFYAHADYRWSLDGGRSRQTATQGSIGIRFNW